MGQVARVAAAQLKHNSYFVAGLCAGLWLALAAVPLGEEECAPPATAGAAVPAAAADEFAAVHEARAPAPAPARSVQRPRYYTTELGMRAPLLAAVLSSEDMLESRVAALNRTAARLQPALRFFVSAGAPPALPAPPAPPAPRAAPRANVVAFTDTREMLKPFHALKYLADNYLDDYNFFFLATDATYVNARRLRALAARLSVSQHLYMGVAADDDSHYCSLEGGVLLSHSVLRAVHAALDWCVRNSYSPRHHENVGRCVLHAARRPCQAAAQGEVYESVDVSGEGGVARALRPALARAVTARGLAHPADLYRLHVYVSRVQLERLRGERAAAAAALARLRARHPRGARNTTWPRGLRLDPALRPLAPDNRFDHLRWTAFNATHAFLPDDRRSVAPVPKAHREALELVWRRARAWAGRAWGGDAALVEGAWRWEPPHALRYRLLLAHRPAAGAGAAPARVRLRGVEVARALGGARLAAVPYVTESARVALLLAVPAAERAAAAAWLRAHRTQPRATALTVVLIDAADGEQTDWADVRAALAELAPGAVAGPPPALLQTTAGAGGLTDAGRLALAAAGGGGAGGAAGGGGLARDALVLLLHPRATLSDEFLNRVRMNTIAGCAWFLPAPFARYPRPPPARAPHAAAGRFAPPAARSPLAMPAFYKRDWDAALGAWRGDPAAPVPAVLAASALRVLSAPEPALALTPAPRRPQPPPELPLGEARELAKLLLDAQPAPAPAA